MGEEEFPGNSRMKRPPPAKPERKKVERVTEGTVIRRKKPLRRRLLETFVGGDARGAWGYVVLDILIPAARDMIADAGREGIERMVYGESRPRSRRGPRGEPAGHVPYNRYSSYGRRDEPRREMSRRGRALHDFDEIILDSRAEAEEVLDRLYDMVERYDSATVSDLYEMCDISGNDFAGQKWGWTDMAGARVTRVRNGYLLDLPRPEPLD